MYPWSTAESLMHHARRTSLLRFLNTLLELATLFNNRHLNRFLCCNSPYFLGCVRDVDGRSSIIFGCIDLLIYLLQLMFNLIVGVMQQGVTEIHADATFKIVPRSLGYQLLTIHFMIENYVRYTIFHSYFSSL